MTQLETPPQLNIDSRPPAPSDTRPPSPFWWIAFSLACVVMLVAVVAFIITLPGDSPKPFADAQVPVKLADFKATMPASALTAGAKTLQITNGGATVHELLVFQPGSSIDPAHLPLDANGNINEDAPGLNKVSDGDNIDPGQSQARQLDLSQPGTYVFVCNLPGHYKAGMWSKVTVR